VKLVDKIDRVLRKALAKRKVGRSQRRVPG